MQEELFYSYMLKSICWSRHGKMRSAVRGRHFQGHYAPVSRSEQLGSNSIPLEWVWAHKLVLCLIKVQSPYRMDSHSRSTKLGAKAKDGHFSLSFQSLQDFSIFRKVTFQQQTDYKKKKEINFSFHYLFWAMLWFTVTGTAEQDKCVDLRLRCRQQRQSCAFCRIFYFKEFKEYFLLQSQISPPLAGSCSTSYFDSYPRWTPGKDLSLK